MREHARCVAREVTAENNCFACRPRRNNENIGNLGAAGRLIGCIFMHSARTRCSGSTRVRRCFMNDIFSSAFYPGSCSGIKRDATHPAGVFAIPVSKSFTGRLAGAGIRKTDRKINRATLPHPHPRTIPLISSLRSRVTRAMSPRGGNI